MRKTIYYQRDAADPVLEDGLVLDIVSGYAPGAKSVTGMDDSHGEARAYAVDDNIILKVQRPQQLRSSTSLEKEAFFLRELEAQTDVSVPRVLGYGKRGSVEYICMTRMPGIAAEKVKLSATEKDALLFELGKELRKIHSANQKLFEESGLFPRDGSADLTERLQLRYGAAIQKKKDGISSEKLAFALCEVETTLQYIHDTDEFVALHANPYIPHGVTRIFFIANRFADTLGAPFAAKRTWHASTVQILANCSEGFSGDNAGKYLTNNRCSGGINLNTVLRYAISEQKPPVEQFTVLKALADTPLLILACRQAFLLCIRCEYGKHQLTLGAHCVNILLLEKNIHLQSFQLTDCFQ